MWDIVVAIFEKWDLDHMNQANVTDGGHQEPMIVPVV